MRKTEKTVRELLMAQTESVSLPHGGLEKLNREFLLQPAAQPGGGSAFVKTVSAAAKPHRRRLAAAAGVLAAVLMLMAAVLPMAEILTGIGGSPNMDSAAPGDSKWQDDNDSAQNPDAEHGGGTGSTITYPDSSLNGSESSDRLPYYLGAGLFAAGLAAAGACIALKRRSGRRSLGEHEDG